MDRSNHLFTASDIARALRCTPQNVRQRLATTLRGGEKVSRGNLASAWSVESLPTSLFRELELRAQRLGFPTPYLLLRSEPATFTPALPLREVAPAEIESARKLQIALSPCWTLGEEASVSELARSAALTYRDAFGYTVSDRHLRDLISRTIARDGGHQNFARLEIYLSERPQKKEPAATLPAVPHSLGFADLDEAFSVVADRAKPSATDIAYCWRKVVACYAERVAAGTRDKAVKRGLRDYILKTAPFLGDSAEAVKRNLNRKIQLALDNGISALVDGRKSLELRNTSTQAQWESAINQLFIHARHHTGGRVSQAYRELHLGTGATREQFSEAFRDAFPFDVRTAKSQVPNWLRNVVTARLSATAAKHLGPRAARIKLPSLRRDWSKVLAGSSYTSDDQTSNHYIYDVCDEGEYEFDGMRFNVSRPQILPVVDERTDYPLGYCLIPAPSYNSRHIRTLITQICMQPEIGLPFERFLFEKGIWQSRNVEALANWSTVDESFARHGVNLQMRHATTPKAKIIERVIGTLQNLADYLPGNAGRNEQLVKYERVQKFLLRLKRARQPLKASVDPREMLMSKAQFAAHLDDVLNRFANEPQNGERLPGISPAEGWAQLSGGRAHVVLPESLRFLLGTEQSEPTVTSDGISLTIGSAKHIYFGSEQLGALIGEKVRVRYNSELPEQIVVSHIASDPHGLSPFAVPLYDRLPAHGASNEQFARAREQQKSFARFGETIYRVFKPTNNRTVSYQEIGSPELRATGAAHNRLEREAIELRDERAAHSSEIRDLSKRLNLPIDTATTRRPSERLKHLRNAAAYEEEIRQMEAAGDAAPATVKAYVLNTPSKPLSPAQRTAIYWRLWNAAEKAQPGISRFALTSRALGSVKKIAEMSEAEFSKVCRLFESIARKQKQLQ